MRRCAIGVSAFEAPSSPKQSSDPSPILSDRSPTKSRTFPSRKSLAPPLREHGRRDSTWFLTLCSTRLRTGYEMLFNLYSCPVRRATSVRPCSPRWRHSCMPMTAFGAVFGGMRAAAQRIYRSRLLSRVVRNGDVSATMVCRAAPEISDPPLRERTIIPRSVPQFSHHPIARYFLPEVTILHPLVPFSALLRDCLTCDSTVQRRCASNVPSASSESGNTLYSLAFLQIFLGAYLIWQALQARRCAAASARRSGILLAACGLLCAPCKGSNPFWTQPQCRFIVRLGQLPKSSSSWLQKSIQRLSIVER